MSKLPDIAYSFGNVFEDKDCIAYMMRGCRFISFIGERALFLDGDTGTYEMPKKDAKKLHLVGITPACLAELARDHRERMAWSDYLEDIDIFKDSDLVFTTGKKIKETFEEFCLRVAKERKYL